MKVIDFKSLDGSNAVLPNQSCSFSERKSTSRENSMIDRKNGESGKVDKVISNMVDEMDCFETIGFTVAWDAAARDVTNFEINEKEDNNYMYILNENPGNHDTRRVVTVIAKEEGVRWRMMEIVKRNTMLYFGRDAMKAGSSIKVKLCESYLGEGESESESVWRM